MAFPKAFELYTLHLASVIQDPCIVECETPLTTDKDGDDDDEWKQVHCNKLKLYTIKFLILDRSGLICVNNPIQNSLIKPHSLRLEAHKLPLSKHAEQLPNFEAAKPIPQYMKLSL
ncbi:jg17477 [Pararge aegeria aegeria]|uniref:Jg17477 protein n=1 Tax=Pararge aegeria aegeria TaxID=348720 RepID=A0A8S4RK26_9NEOP|nr:jg17477 [Pararge aegeria aegeria]